MTVTLNQKQINHGEFFTIQSLTDLLEAATGRLATIKEMFGDEADPIIAAAQDQFNFAETSVFAMASTLYARDIKLSEAQADEAMRAMAYQLNVILLAGLDARLFKQSEVKPLGENIAVLMQAVEDFRVATTIAVITAESPADVPTNETVAFALREPDLWD